MFDSRPNPDEDWMWFLPALAAWLLYTVAVAAIGSAVTWWVMR